MSAARPLSLELLLDIVKHEAARREGKSLDGQRSHDLSASSSNLGIGTESRLLPTYLLGTPRKHVRDFLPLLGEEFISEAFKTLLWRAPEADAKEAYLSALALGRVSRWEILLRIRWSAEGRRRGIKIRGLVLTAAFSIGFRLPIFGFILNTASTVLALPFYLRDSRHTDALAFALLRSFGR